jgi:hypothetical protein
VTTRVPAIETKHRSFSRTTSALLEPEIDAQHHTTSKASTPPLIVQKTKMAYYCAGSGIPEVKVILGGFVIKGFLGIKTLFVKSVGLVSALPSWYS